MFVKLLLNNVLILSFLLILSESFAMDPDDPLYEAKMAFMRQLNLEAYRPVNTPFNHDPDRVQMEKQKHSFSPIHWETITKSADTKQIHVPMGKFHWVQPETDTILYTDKVQDCIGIVLVGPQVSLGHISNDSKDHTLLKEILTKIEDSKSYRIYFVSHYYSKNLDEVTSIVKTKFPNIYADISDNVMEYGPNDFHKWYYSEQHNMQAQNLASRTVCIDAKTGHISNELPK